MNDIEKIIEELIEFEPELKTRKKELSLIIKALMESKPDTKFDQNFAKNLRAKLLTYQSINKTTNPNPMKKLSYILSGALVVAIVGSAGYFGMNYVKTAQKFERKLISMTPTIVSVKENAFGPLLPTQEVPIGGFPEGLSSFSKGEGLGGGGGGGGGTPAVTSTTVEPAATYDGGDDALDDRAEVSLDKQDSAIAESSPDVSDAANSTGIAPQVAPDSPKLIPADTLPVIEEMYWPTVYTYVYDGTLDVPTDKVSVLKRIIGENKKDGGFINLLKNLGFNMMNLDKLQNPYIDYIGISEDKDFGYSISATLSDESFSISQNYKRWPQCYTQECWESQKPITLSDIPDDTTLISKAKNFLKEYDISVDGLGDPFVDSYFKTDYKRAIAEGFEPYMPDTLNVTFPLKLNNMYVYYDGGNKSGISVNYSLREDKIAGAWNFTSQNYEDSKYKPASKEMVQTILEKGGLNNYLWAYSPLPGEKVKEVTVKLKNPERGYMRYWNYDEGQGEELLVEALIFEIETPAEDPYMYQQFVTVPLAKEIIDNAKVQTYAQ
ncbi:MAG: hypothetical protein WC269_04680 [Candidatus Gracilibacteria bacterium]|jgi:hypothetical protein